MDQARLTRLRELAEAADRGTNRGAFLAEFSPATALAMLDRIAELEAGEHDSDTWEQRARKRASTSLTLLGRLKEVEAHCRQLQVDIDGETAWRMEFRRKHGAREDETMMAFLDRLAHEREAALLGLTQKDLFKAMNEGHIAGLAGKLQRVEVLLSANGCDCDCDHHPEEHAAECERCLACKVSTAIF